MPSLVNIDYEQAIYLTLKSLNLFFIFLQSRIFESMAFHKFVRSELRKLISLAKNHKKMAITYRYNNWKIQKVLTIQSKKKQMQEGVSELKVKLSVWKQMITSMTSSSLSGFFNQQQRVDDSKKDEHKAEENK